MESSMANTQEEQLHTIARDTRLNDDSLLRSIAWLSNKLSPPLSRLMRSKTPVSPEGSSSVTALNCPSRFSP
jgi:hypothetical protein